MKPLLAHSPRYNTGAQTYFDHITNVNNKTNVNAQAAVRYYTGNPLAFLETVHAASLYHDIGKLDVANQDVLSRISKEGLPIPHEDAGVEALRKLKRLEAAVLVQAHHSGLFDASDETSKKDRAFRNIRSIKTTGQIVADYVDAFLDDYRLLHAGAGLALLNEKAEPKLKKCGFTRRIALSCLVDADHGDTAQNYGREVPITPIHPRWLDRLAALDQYVKELPQKSTRDALRQEAYKACRDADIASSIRCCDAPVGSGKTTAVMAHLLRVAQERGLRHIIVVLPYTNIIKQSVEVYRKALTLPGEHPEDVVAEHHHRADFSTIDLRQLATLWQAPIIVTTAVQFFETLASHHPARLRKLHELPGSAVFVDEVHSSLPSHLWGQNWKWLETWTQEWGGYLVLASGSLPRFWETDTMVQLIGQGKIVQDLLPDAIRQQLIQAEQHRIRYKSIEKPISVNNLIERVKDSPGPRLVILNTIQSAAIVADELQRQGHLTMHLSTALTPQDRDRIVERVIARLNSTVKDWTLVATSCVEAGMNFSFCSGFRERSTTSSLIQVGGRVSRGAEFEDATVWDFLIEDTLITHNPDLELARRVLRHLLASDEVNTLPPGELAKLAMQREMTEGDLERAQELIAMESKMCYPTVGKLGQVIKTDTRTVVISTKVAEAIRKGDKLPSRELQRNSVQMWTSKIKKQVLPLELIAGSSDDWNAIYAWTAEYDSDFLGYMAGALPIVRTIQEGVFIG